MTRDELAALEAAASPAPWTYEYRAINDLHWGAMGSHLLHRGEHTNYVANREDSAEAADFALAAAARNALPELLRRLDLAEQALAGASAWAECVGGEECEQAATACGGCKAADAARAALSAIRAPLDQPQETP